MTHTVVAEIPRVIHAGLSRPGVNRQKVSFIASRPATSISSATAAGYMILSSEKAFKKTAFCIPPMFRQML